MCYCLQDDCEDVFAEVQLLLSLSQFCRICGQASDMYCDPQSVVLYKTYQVVMCMCITYYVITALKIFSQVTVGVMQVAAIPSVILDWDPHSSTLNRISIEVCMYGGTVEFFYHCIIIVSCRA